MAENSTIPTARLYHFPSNTNRQTELQTQEKVSISAVDVILLCAALDKLQRYKDAIELDSYAADELMEVEIGDMYKHRVEIPKKFYESLKGVSVIGGLTFAREVSGIVQNVQEN